MRDSIAVLLFVSILVLILTMYVIAALYFDGFLDMLGSIESLLKDLWGLIKVVVDSVYRTFVA